MSTRLGGICEDLGACWADLKATSSYHFDQSGPLEIGLRPCKTVVEPVGGAAGKAFFSLFLAQTELVRKHITGSGNRVLAAVCNVPN